MENNNYTDFKIGFTTLSLLEKSPKLFKQYQDNLKEGIEEKQEEYFKIGSAIHCKILEPDEFDKRYYVSTFKAPEGKYADAIKYLAEYDSITDKNIEEVIALVDLKGKFDTIKNKLLNDITYIEYLKDLKNSKGKIILSPEDSVLISNCVNNLLKHKKTTQLLLDNPFDNGLITSNEELIEWKFKDFKFTISSTIDRLIIDPLQKTITIIDLKTTSKYVSNFIYSYSRYKYYRQAAIYNEAVKYKYLSQDKYKDYKIINYIPVVETIGLNEVRLFSITEQDLEVGLNEFELLLKRLDYHILNNVWEYNMEYYTGSGIDILDLNEKD